MQTSSMVYFYRSILLYCEHAIYIYNKNKAFGKYLENIFYKALYNLNEDFFKYIEKSSKGKHLLDYGCGVGNNLNNVSNFQAERITCIDISEVSIF